MPAVIKRNISEHLYEDATATDDVFGVYQTDQGWFWSFSPVWRDPGPFKTEAEAIKAGEAFVDETGKLYIE